MASQGITNGQVAYEAYAGTTEWRSAISGEPLPLYHEQSDLVRRAWEAAGDRVAERVAVRGETLEAKMSPGASAMFALTVVAMLCATVCFVVWRLT